MTTKKNAGPPLAEELFPGLSEAQMQYMQIHQSNMLKLCEKLAVSFLGPQHIPRGQKAATKTSYIHGAPILDGIADAGFQSMVRSARGLLDLSGLITIVAHMCGRQFGIHAAKKGGASDPQFAEEAGRLFEGGFRMSATSAEHEATGKLVVPGRGGVH